MKTLSYEFIAPSASANNPSRHARTQSPKCVLARLAERVANPGGSTNVALTMVRAGRFVLLMGVSVFNRFGAFRYGGTGSAVQVARRVRAGLARGGFPPSGGQWRPGWVSPR